MTDDSLRDRWQAEAALAATPGDARAVAYAELAARYGEGHRSYHTLRHVGAVLDAIERLDDTAPPAVHLAAWYHDVIYDPAAGDNEAASAQLARTVLAGLGVEPATVAETARLIELTRDHAVSPGDAAGATLVDADLSILGAAAPTYDRYSRAVRAEYGHVPDVAWRSGRSAVLRSLLDRPALFHTATGRARWEDQARHNLRRELEALSRSPAP